MNKPNRPLTSRPWLLSVGIALIVVAWLASGQMVPSKDATEASGTAVAMGEMPSSVRVRRQSAEQIRRYIVVNGNTAPARTVKLAAETDGRVASLGLKRGHNGDRGALVVRLDERDRQARIAAARAVLNQRQAEYEARERLKSSSYVSDAQLKEARALLESARMELVRSELDLKYARIVAPFAGALLERQVEVGDFVSRGDPVATWVDNRRLVVTASLSEHDAVYVEAGQPAEARLATGEAVRGRIRFVAPVADHETRTFVVELEVDNGDGKRRAGGTAELRIAAETVLAHRIATSLLTLNDAGNVGIKIVTDDNRVRFVATDIAIADDNGVWLTGLPNEAVIITVGQGYVADGAVVTAVPESNRDTTLAVKGDPARGQ